MLDGPTRWRFGSAALPVAAIFLLTAALHAGQVTRPILLLDDFQIVAGSWTWSRTVENLWQPHNEHTMPLGRLSAWVLVQLAGDLSRVPVLGSLQGPLAVFLGMALVYRLVRRELSHPFYGMAAMALFGISSQYREAVYWYSTSLSIFGLDTALLALLAAQRWRQGAGNRHLWLCALWSALAPGWFANGILAGPLCVVYLLPGSRMARDGLRLVPLLGTTAFLTVNLVLNADTIMHLEHYGQKTALESFHPATGMIYTARSLVDNLLLGSFGVPSGYRVPEPWVYVVSALFACALAAWWRLAPERRLLWLGLAFILGSDLLSMSARSEWDYQDVNSWNRYQLYPQLGLVLYVCGGLPRWRERWLQPGRVRTPGRLGWIVALALLCVIQWPRDEYRPPNARQMKELRRIEALDAKCREHRIDAETARRALAPYHFVIHFSTDRVSGWDFLRGSPEPLPTSVERARELLGADARGIRKIFP